MLAWGTQQLSASTSVNKLIAGGWGPHNLLQLNTNCRLWCQAAVLQMGRPSHTYRCIGSREGDVKPNTGVGRGGAGTTHQLWGLSEQSAQYSVKIKLTVSGHRSLLFYIRYTYIRYLIYVYSREFPGFCINLYSMPRQSGYQLSYELSDILNHLFVFLHDNNPTVILLCDKQVGWHVQHPRNLPVCSHSLAALHAMGILWLEHRIVTQSSRSHNACVPANVCAYVYVCVSVYLFMMCVCLYVCVCVCASVCVWQGKSQCWCVHKINCTWQCFSDSAVRICGMFGVYVFVDVTLEITALVCNDLLSWCVHKLNGICQCCVFGTVQCVFVVWVCVCEGVDCVLWRMCV